MGKRIKVLYRLIAVSCLVVVTLTGCNLNKMKTVTTKSKVQSEKEYLDYNYMTLDTKDNNDFSSFKLLSEDLKKDIFLTGQVEGVKANGDLELKFLKYFHENAGVKYYLQEIPYSFARSVNQYLETGNEKILEDLFASAKGSPFWSKEQYNKWKKVYELNKSLTNDKKIIVLGIDVEHVPSYAFKYMISMLPNEAPPMKINGAIEELKNAADISPKNGNAIKDFCTRLKNSIDENRDDYNLYLKDKLFDFEMINNNVLKSIDVNSSKTWEEFYKSRGQKEYENFMYLYSNMPDKGKIYGQLYENNIFQKAHKGTEYFAALLNGKDSPVKNKLLSIMYIYKSCNNMIVERNGSYNHRSFSNYSSDNTLIDPLIQEDITLIKLNGEGSPFEKDLLWFDNFFYPGTRSGDEATTDYYQYVVVIKNSEAEVSFDK